ncbi:class I SAM-dependent DNA methyltransferase [Dactylosporangium sp. CA-152071]|uniref:class I SAM-dependent DNA methyltransferase n=1 Tax=Dactylosporangium sp. CA-152071 TaxID=3239933 RepID=UPI003D8FAA2B
MSAIFDSITNRGEYLSAHYFAEQLATDLRKGLFATWSIRENDEHDPRNTPRELLRGLRGTYLGEDVRGSFAAAAQADADGATFWAVRNDTEQSKRLTAWHQEVLRALGYAAKPTDLTVHRSGRDHVVPVAFHGHGIVAVDCGWAADTDTALDPDSAGRLLSALRISGTERYDTGAALAAWLFQSELGGAGGPRPRFVLLLHGGVVILADRNAWSEGRYLAASLDTALERNDRAQYGELATIAALFSLDLLRPGDNDRAPGIDALLKASATNAVGVSADLRHGLQRSVEIIANEVLHRMAEPGNGVTPADIEHPGTPFVRELTRECLRFLYRILFLLYAEARPELGILPADDGSYEAGYSMARLRELVARDEELIEEEARNGFHLYASLDVLFNKVNYGHRGYGTEPDDDQPDDDETTRQEKAARRSEDLGLRFEALRSELFEPTAIRLIGTRVVDPTIEDETHPRWLDLRLRNAALHQVLRLLTMKQGARGERGGFISYRNLGINQLGAVYEGLMSYTGIIATEELCEVARNGSPELGSWLIPAHRQDQYPDAALVQHDEDDARRGLRGPKKYPKGSFVYRLAGRERETSASYYTPESLTRVTVELALKERLDQGRDAEGNVVRTRAAELLTYKICEPALGSGAFLNEAINQVAEEYLRRRQEELGKSVPAGEVLTEKQRAKAYIALHNAYGVDLNATGVELAEVSLWLNTMHPGMRAPWFGLHLRRGNSLIGARRAVYAGDDVSSTAKAWLKAKGGLAPTPLPLRADGHPQPLDGDSVHQFLLPAAGWAAVAGSTDAKKLDPQAANQLGAWRRGILQRPKRSDAHLNKDGSRKIQHGAPKPELPSQFTRLRDAARRAEFLWTVVVKRMQLSEEAIARRVEVWGADPEDSEYQFIRYPKQAASKEQVLTDLFKAVDTPYWRLKTVMDAWCALWFWPAERAGLLDGTAAEYSASPAPNSPDSLAELLGSVPTNEVPALEPTTDAPPVDLSPPVDSTVTQPAARTVSALFRPMTLFPVDGEQGTFDDLDWGAGDTVEQPAPKARSNSRRRTRPPLTNRRSVIALKDLDDWLDFVESMLGTADVPDGTFIDQYETLTELKQFEGLLPEWMGMDTADPETRYPWLRVVRNIAAERGFLHWELEFALVFAHSGGFDLQVGNPPWVRPDWDADAVLAEHEPWFALQEKPSESEKERRRRQLLKRPEVRSYVLGELTTTSAHASFLSSAQTYPLLAGTRPNLYRAFMCQVWAHTSDRGTAGMLHPDTHFTGDNEGPLREAAYRRLHIHGDFVNSGQRFFPRPVGDTAHFGVHIYGQPKRIRFNHLSWLVSADSLRYSPEHDGSGPVPGIRLGNSEFDERPHRTRVITVDEVILAVWRRLLDEEDRPLGQTRLLFPVSTAEATAIATLADYPLRLVHLDLQMSGGLSETNAKAENLIEHNRADPAIGERYQPASWDGVILKGIQIGLATAVFKRHDANSNDPYGADLVTLPQTFVPDSAYIQVPGRSSAFQAAHDRWVDHAVLARSRADNEAVDRARHQVAMTTGVPETETDPAKVEAALVEAARRPSVDFYRLAWRRQIATNTERALYAALIPPGVTHIEAVHSLILPSTRQTALVAGFWASLPLDYFLRATARNDLRTAGAKAMPAPAAEHPLASALLLRTLRLNCLTAVYADLWVELFDPTWLIHDRWACDWKGLPPLQAVTPDWRLDTPLRTERARRSALVEIDALVAVWLGMNADALISAYRGRFPVLQKYEAVTWFDADGWKLASNARTFGQRQSKTTWAQFEAYRNDTQHVPPPEGYTPPFHRADREAEMREAHKVFQAQLDAAMARGEWDPATREVTRS